MAFFKFESWFTLLVLQVFQLLRDTKLDSTGKQVKSFCLDWYSFSTTQFFLRIARMQLQLYMILFKYVPLKSHFSLSPNGWPERRYRNHKISKCAFKPDFLLILLQWTSFHVSMDHGWIYLLQTLFFFVSNSFTWPMQVWAN